MEVASAVTLAEPRALATGTLGAVLVLIFVPSSATAVFPIGSLYPIVVALMFLLFGITRARDRMVSPPFLSRLLWFYAIVTFLSLFANRLDPFFALLPVVILLVYWSTYSAQPGERQIIASGIVIAALVQALLAAGEVFLRTGVLVGQPFLTSPVNPFLEGLPRAQGTLSHPITFGFVIIAAMGILCTERSRPVLRVLLLTVFAGSTLLSGASSIVAVALLILTGWFLYRSSWAGRTFSLLAVLIATLLVAASSLIPRVLEQELDPQSAGHRLNSIASVPNLMLEQGFLETLLGNGYGSLRSLYASGILVDDGFYAVDNQYVTFLVQGGLIGAALVIGTLISISSRIANSENRRFIIGWIGLISLGFSFDFMAWYVAAALFFVYAALGQTSPLEPKKTGAE